MITKTVRCGRFGRRACATLTTLSAVAIAAGCATNRWVPLTRAPPNEYTERLRVAVPSDSTTPTARTMTLYNPRMEGDSVLAGRAAPTDTLVTRVGAASALVEVSDVHVVPTLAVLAGIGAVIAIIVAAQGPWVSYH